MAITQIVAKSKYRAPESHFPSLRTITEYNSPVMIIKLVTGCRMPSTLDVHVEKWTKDLFPHCNERCFAKKHPIVHGVVLHVTEPIFVLRANLLG